MDRCQVGKMQRGTGWGVDQVLSPGTYQIANTLLRPCAPDAPHACDEQCIFGDSDFRRHFVEPEEATCDDFGDGRHQ